MTISPLIPHLPAFLSFFIYGVVIAGLFRYGKRGGRGCLFPLIFWYGFAILSVFLALLVSVQETTNQASFAVGVLIPFARSMWESEAVQAPLHFVRVTIDTIQHTAWKIGRLWQAWQERRASNTDTHSRATGQGNRGNGHQSQGNNQNNQHTQDQARDRERHQEQQQREAEAHARREQAERERQERQNANKPPPDTDDAPRDPEAVLGLKTGYTDEDLRTAYKREAGRTHPDKWIGKPEAIRQMMEAEYKAIQEAYKILKRS